MRTIIALAPLALASLGLAGCNVSKEGNAVTVQYDQNTAENAAADVGNFAEGVGQTIANDVERTADKVQNADVDVDVDANVQTNNQ